MGSLLVWALGAAAFAAGHALFALGASSVPALGLAFILAGVGIGCAETAQSAAVAGAAPIDLRGSAFGMLAGIQALGYLAASAVAEVIWTAVSPRAAFLYLGTWMLVALVTLGARSPSDPFGRVNSWPGGPTAGAASALNDVAERGVVGSGGGTASPQCNSLQITLHPLKGGDPLRNVGGVLLDQPRNVPTRTLTSVADGEDLADLPKGQPHGLRRSDEAQANRRVAVVVAVPGRGSRRLRQDPDVLVVPDGLRRDPGSLTQLPDSHLPMITS